MFKRLMFAITLVSALVVAGFATPSVAEARHGHRGHHHDCHDGGHYGRSRVSFYYGGGYDPYYYSYPAVVVPRSYYGYYGPSYYYPSYYGRSNVSFSIGF